MKEQLLAMFADVGEAVELAAAGALPGQIATLIAAVVAALEAKGFSRAEAIEITSNLKFSK